MAFDPDSGTPALKGFTLETPSCEIPSRACSDNFFDQYVYPSNADRDAVQFTGDRVGSHADAGVTKDSGEQFSTEKKQHENDNLQEKIGN